MKPEEKATPPGAAPRRAHKTKDDFLRWLRQQEEQQQPAASEQSDHAAADGTPADADGAAA